MTRTLIRLVVFLALPAAVAVAAEPTYLNADVRPLGAPAPDLERAFTSLMKGDEGPAWVAYTVPMVGRSLCCHSPSVCSLEGSGDCYLNRSDPGDDATMRVLVRFHKRRVTEIRAFSSGCRLDAGGLPVYVWDGVEPRRSVDFLVERAGAGNEDVAEGAIMSIAHHDDAEVDRVLERVAHGELLPRRAEEAVFWLGEARGDAGFEALERLRHEVRDHDVLEKVAFALHLSEAAGALPALIDMARNDADGDVRGTALFWLSQQAGERAAAAIAEASEEDPDLDVKERAIFALSQLPPDRGVPLLIRYAQTHESREIRKKAMFWLGQTEDPRALDFFEEILR